MQRRTTPCTELHGRYRRPKELRRNAKNPGKTRVLPAERTGTELLSVFPTFCYHSKDAILGSAGCYGKCTNRSKATVMM
jgi:hypothetical protein